MVKFNLMEAMDRGLHIRTHPSLGMDVHMYVDTPGVYFDAHGTEVDPKLAEQAGFPVDEQLKMRKMMEAKKAALEEIDKEFGQAKSKVVMEREGYKIVDIGMGRYNVLTPDAMVLNAKGPISKEQAEVLMKHLAPAKQENSKAK